MHCPKCNSNNIKVMETAQGCHNNIFRRRKCVECDTLFRTVETLIGDDEGLNREYSSTPRFKAALAKLAERSKQHKKGK